MATNDIEVERLDALFDRATQNQVPDIRILDGEKAIKKVEPYCKGLKAIHSPHTGKYYWSSSSLKILTIFRNTFS